MTLEITLTVVGFLLGLAVVWGALRQQVAAMEKRITTLEASERDVIKGLAKIDALAQEVKDLGSVGTTVARMEGKVDALTSLMSDYLKHERIDQREHR